jgi:hypothetical protein
MPKAFLYPRTSLLINLAFSLSLLSQWMEILAFSYSVNKPSQYVQVLSMFCWCSDHQSLDCLCGFLSGPMYHLSPEWLSCFFNHLP